MMTTDVAKATSDAGGQGIRFVRSLVAINLGLVGLQALSAGFLMSGHARALSVHSIGAVALQFGALIQVVAAVVLWRRRRLPAWVAGIGLGLFVMVFLQSGFGYRRLYWLHVPLGVGLFGGLTRQTNKLETLWRTTGAPSRTLAALTDRNVGH